MSYRIEIRGYWLGTMGALQMLAAACLAGNPYVNLKGVALQNIYEDGDFEAGKIKMQTYLQGHPADVNANFMLGLLWRDHSLKPDNTKALRCFLRAYDGFPGAVILSEIAATYYAMGDEKKGLEYLERSHRQSKHVAVLTESQRKTGQGELEKMLADLPEMKLYLTDDPEMRDWAVAAFAGADNSGPTWWEGTSVSMAGASAVSSDSVLERGGIELTIRVSEEKDPYVRGSHYWSSFVFETINNKKRLRFNKVGLRTRWDHASAETHSAQLWLAELDTYADTFAFFCDRWRPYCLKNNLKISELGWYSHAGLNPEDVVSAIGKKASESFNVYRQNYQDSLFPLNLEVAKKRGLVKPLVADLEARRLEAMEYLAKAYFDSGEDKKCAAMVEQARSLKLCSDTIEVLGFLASLRSQQEKQARLGCTQFDLDKKGQFLLWANDLHGKGKNFEAAQILRYLAQKGDVEAKLGLFQYYFHGLGVPRDLNYLRGELESAMKLGSADAGYHLAQGYLWGSLGPVDPDKALAIVNKVDDGQRTAYALRTWAYDLKGPRFKKDAIQNAAKGAALCQDYCKRMLEHLTQKPFVTMANCGEARALSPTVSDNLGYPPVPALRGAALDAKGDRLLVDDFEGNTRTNRLGGAWYTSADTFGLGTRLETNFIVSPGPAGKGHCARMTGHYGRKAAPWPFASLNSTLDAATLADLSAFKAVEFMAKGDGKRYDVLLYLNQVTDFAHFKHAFDAPKTWTKIRLPFDEFRQPDWGKPMPQDFHAVKELLFSSSDLDDENFDLSIDDVAFVK